MLTNYLISQDWASLRAFFEVNAPVSAQDFHARGILEIAENGGRVDWRAVLADLSKACERAPANPIFRANFAQALIDSGSPDEGYLQAVQAVLLGPQLYSPLEKLALAAEELHRWEEAREAAVRAALALERKQTVPEPTGRLLMQLQSRWWLPLVSASLTLRRPQPSDSDFIDGLFSDADYLRRFHRFQRSGQQEVRHFIEVAQQSPYRSRRLDWIVCNHKGLQLGQAGLVAIDWENRRAELVVGFPGQPPVMAALQTSLRVIDFAFRTLGLAKLVSYVYADNPKAQSNTLHLGFRNEGLLRGHVSWGCDRIDVYVNGMLAVDYEADGRLQKLCARWLFVSPA